VDLKGISILVIDDDADSRDLLDVMLRACGATVRVVASARDGVVACDQAKPDIIVSDIAMPGHDGYTFLRALRTRSACASVPAIAVTGYAHHRERALAAGFDDVMIKPVDHEALCELVGHHVTLA
jgi:CheY-like chemotaxis protein